MSHDEFVKKARQVHGDGYDYNVSQYKGADHRMTIRCRKHGNWETTANNHLTGRGCPACATSGFDQTKPGRLYYLRVYDRVLGSTYKIGITNRTVSERFQNSDLDKITLIKRWHYQNGYINPGT